MQTLASHTALYLLFGIHTLLTGSTLFMPYPQRVKSYARHLWLYLLFIVIAVKFSFMAASIILAVISFLALREYFSLITFRQGDRTAIWGAFLAVPLMLMALSTGSSWTFITFGPLYSFCFLPLLVSIGSRDHDGVLFSAASIGFGLFLFVYGNGLFGFLAQRDIWLALVLLINVSVCEAIAFLLFSTQNHLFPGKIKQFLVTIPVTAATTAIVSDWTSLSFAQALYFGGLIPLLVAAIRYFMTFVELDLGTGQDYHTLRRGRLINSSCSLVMITPVLFFLIFNFLE